MKIVISDSSVLISLSRIGQLDLISQLFPEGILIPEEVWKEVVENGQGRPGATQVKKAEWIKIKKIENHKFAHLLKMELDKGEAEAITLANEINADLILIDERDARQIAKQLDLKVLGTIGLLIWSKKAGNIPSLKKVMDELVKDAGFRVSRAVYKKALKAVNEKANKI